MLRYYWLCGAVVSTFALHVKYPQLDPGRRHKPSIRVILHSGSWSQVQINGRVVSGSASGIKSVDPSAEVTACFYSILYDFGLSLISYMRLYWS